MKRSSALVLAVVGGLLLAALPASAQFQFFKAVKPQIDVPVQHPPRRGLTLAGKKVAFAPVSGQACASQLANLLMQDFQSKGSQLVERASLDSILAEHNLQVSGSVDPASAVQIGKLLGPSAMAFVTVNRCETERKRLNSSDVLNHPIYISQTQAFVTGTLRVVDLTTGQDLGVSNTSVSPMKQNSDSRGYPEFAPDAEVLDGAMQHAADQVEEDYFPWTETLSVEFLKDSDCDLKQAYNMVKAGDVAGALQQSQANVATCQADKNQTHQAHALYNLGVAQMLAGHYDEALRSIRKAEVLHDDRRNGEALGQAQRLQANAQEMASNQAVQAAAAASAQHQADARQQRVASETLDNATIVKLVKGGFSDAVVVKMIASQPGSYTTTPDALLSLKQSGVSDTVIAALLDKKN